MSERMINSKGGNLNGAGWEERQRQAKFLDPKYKFPTTFHDDFVNSLSKRPVTT